jgi:hypothetical protein
MASLKNLIAIVALINSVSGVNNGLARTPQMGWVRTPVILSKTPPNEIKIALSNLHFLEQLEFSRMSRLGVSPPGHGSRPRKLRPSRHRIHLCRPRRLLVSQPPIRQQLASARPDQVSPGNETRS